MDPTKSTKSKESQEQKEGAKTYGKLQSCGRRDAQNTCHELFNAQF